MVIVLAILLSLARLEEEVTSGHLKDHARKRPQIGRLVILGANYDFWRAVLAGLNLR